MRREAPARNARRRGRILRVKQGYNPNSSSMGSIVFALPSLLLGTTVAFGAVAGFIASAFLHGRRRPSAGSPRQARGLSLSKAGRGELVEPRPPTRDARSERRREASNGDGA